MDIPETITKVFTKYDTIPNQIEGRVPIKDFETATCSVKECYWANPYRLTEIEHGFEDMVFAHYTEGGFIPTSETILIDCKTSGEVNIAGRTNG